MISNDSPGTLPETSVASDRLRILPHLYELAAELRALLLEIAGDGGARVTAGLFVLFSLPTCLLLAMLVPPGEVADGPAHLLRGDSLLYGEILGQRYTTTYGGKPVIEGGPALLDGLDLLFAVKHSVVCPKFVYHSPIANGCANRGLASNFRTAMFLKPSQTPTRKFVASPRFAPVESLNSLLKKS